MGSLHPPAKCRSCGLVHPATAFSADNSFETSFEECVVSCPRCGSDSDVLTGVYNFYSNTVELVSGPPSTIAIFQELARVVNASVAAGESPEKTLERASEFLPWLRSGLKGKVAATAFAVLAYFAGKAADPYVDPLFNKPEITIEQVEEVMRKAIKDASLQPPPAFEAGGMSVRRDLHPMLIQFPKTAEKLTKYNKSRGKQ